MSYTFLAESEEVSSAECFSDIPASVLSRLNLTAEKSYCNGNGMESCPSFQYGTTSEHSMVGPGEQKLKQSVRAFPVNGLAQLEMVAGSSKPITTYRFGESFAKWGPELYFWKTPHSLLSEDFQKFYGTWPKWGMMRNGECWELTTSKLHTSEKECGWLPTPMASDGEKCPSDSICRHIQQGIPTTFRKKGWIPTPTATDYKGSVCLQSVNKRQGESKRGVRLPEWLTRVRGENVGTKMHPELSEWLMGWPIGWTDLKPLEMGKFQQWLGSHGRHSCNNPNTL